MAQLVNLDNLQKLLQEMAGDIRDGYKETLERNGRYTALGPEARKLIRSVQTRVVVGETAYEVVMDLEDYWKYVEDDTRPHWPPHDAILRWVTFKPVLPRPDSNGRLPSPESLTYLIRRKISRVGTKGTHDLEKTKDAVITAYRRELEQALAHDIEDYILKVANP